MLGVTLEVENALNELKKKQKSSGSNDIVSELSLIKDYTSNLLQVIINSEIILSFPLSAGILRRELEIVIVSLYTTNT